MTTETKMLAELVTVAEMEAEMAANGWTRADVKRLPSSALLNEDDDAGSDDEETATPMPKAGDRITTTAPVTRIVGETVYTIQAGLAGVVVGSEPGDEWVRILTDDGEIEVYCDPDHADPWHAFSINEDDDAQPVSQWYTAACQSCYEDTPEPEAFGLDDEWLCSDCWLAHGRRASK